MNEVMAYCDFYTLPQNIEQNMEDYLRSRYRSLVFDEQTIITDLNPVLKEDIYEYTRMPYFNANFVFANLRTDVLMKLCEFMKYEMFGENDVIINEGTILRNIYFLENGKAMLTRIDGSRIIYEQFDMIGDISLLLWSKNKVHGSDFSYIYYRSTARITAMTPISCWRVDVKDMCSLFDREMSIKEIRKFVDFIEDVTHEFIYDICHFNETGQTLTSIQDQHAAFQRMIGNSCEKINTGSAQFHNSITKEKLIKQNFSKIYDKNQKNRETKFQKMKKQQPKISHNINRITFLEDNSENIEISKSQLLLQQEKSALTEKLQKLNNNNNKPPASPNSQNNYNSTSNTNKPSIVINDIDQQHQITKQKSSSKKQGEGKEDDDTEIHEKALKALALGNNSGAVIHRERDPSYLQNRWKTAKKKLKDLDSEKIKKETNQNFF